MNAKVMSCLARDILHTMDLEQTFAESRYRVTKILKTAIFVRGLKTGECLFFAASHRIDTVQYLADALFCKGVPLTLDNTPMMIEDIFRHSMNSV